MNHSKNIVDIFDQFLNEKKCYLLARKTKFIQRNSSKLKGHEFLKTLILPSKGHTEDNLNGLSKSMSKYNPEANISAQAVCKRINNPFSVSFVQEAFAFAMSATHSKIVSNIDSRLASVLNPFNRVIIEDSTLCELNKKFAAIYPGTNAKKNRQSHLKIDLIYDILHSSILNAEIHEGKKPDQALAHRINDFIKKNDLVIRDLGYCVIESLKKIEEKGAYYLSRLLPNMKFYLNKEDKEPLNFEKHLSKYYKGINCIELKGYLSAEKLFCRLVIYRQPKNITDRRLREAYQKGKSLKRNLSNAKKSILKFSIFVTNVFSTTLTKEIIGTIYRIRWEIELIFKRWKNLLRLHILEGIDENRIECLVWARLCTAVLMSLMSNFFSGIATVTFKAELSEDKFIKYLLRDSSFCRAISEDSLKKYFEELFEDMPRMLCKDKRKRKTMRQRVYERESYYNFNEI